MSLCLHLVHVCGTAAHGNRRVVFVSIWWSDPELHVGYIMDVLDVHELCEQLLPERLPH